MSEGKRDLEEIADKKIEEGIGNGETGKRSKKQGDKRWTILTSGKADYMDC